MIRNPRLRRRHLLACALPSGLGLAAVAAEATETTDAPARRAEQFLGDLASAHQGAGLALAVQRDGQPVFTRCWGRTRPDAPGAVDPDTRFCLGSLSKPMLAQALLMLAQDGRLRLDDPIRRHLGPVPPHWQAITVRQLLNHTSGLRSAGDPTQPDDMLADPALRSQMQARGGAAFSEAEMLAAFQAFPLRAPPGRGFLYSNAGYDVLGALVGRVTGAPYSAFLQDRLFAPLGMASARFLTADTDFADMATPCEVDADGRVRDISARLLPVQKAFYGGGCGGVQLSLRDLMRWDAGLSGRGPQGGPLPARLAAHAASVPQLWAAPVAMGPQPGEDGRPLRYGLGWIVSRSAWGGAKVGHGGFIPGYRASYARYLGGFSAPTWSVMVLTNQAAIDPDPIVATVARLFAQAESA